MTLFSSHCCLNVVIFVELTFAVATVIFVTWDRMIIAYHRVGLVNGVRTDSNFTTIGAYRCTISVISVIEISLSVYYQRYQRIDFDRVKNR